MCKLYKYILLLIIILMPMLEVKAQDNNIPVRVGISNTSFNTYLFDCIEFNDAQNIEVMDSVTGYVAPKTPDTKIYKVTSENNLFRIYKDDVLVARNLTGPILVRPVQGSSFVSINNLKRKGQQAFYRGYIELTRSKKNISKFAIVNVLSLKNYLRGVVPNEMPVKFGLEALKAQAVAARSYVMRQMERNINKGYDVVDSVTNQVYLDEQYLMTVWKNSYTDNINKIKMAVLQTKGEYLSYDGKVADALFFSTSPGVTENSEEVFSSKEPYLRSVESKWDSISPSYTSQKTYTLNEFYSKLGLGYSSVLNIKIISTTQTGRIQKISINGKEFTGSTVCSKLSLKSTFFEIKQDGNNVIINNKGYGHGVGMSQYGAQGMAKEGYKYDEILKHYYTNIEIKKF